MAFIVWPTKKPNSASLPALYCSTLSALSASTLSTAASIAPLSLSCFSPSRSTMAAAESPVSSIVSSTCLAIEPEIVPLPTSASNSPAWAWLTALSSSDCPALCSAPKNSEISQLLACFATSAGGLPCARAASSSNASNQRAVSTSAVSTPALYAERPSSSL